MRSRRVPALKLGSTGPGGGARSLRLCSQAFASVHKRPQASAECRTCVRLASDAKIVAKRRTVVTFYISHYKSVNSHRDRGGRGCETQNCLQFWTRLVSSRVKSVNSHRDRGGRGRETQKSSLFGLVSCLRVSKVSTVTGIGGVVVAKRRNVVTFGLAAGERKGERREEKREVRGERREEKRRVDRRKERGERRQETGVDRREERRGERRQRRVERIEEGRERGEQREERRERLGDRGEERRDR